MKNEVSMNKQYLFSMMLLVSILISGSCGTAQRNQAKEAPASDSKVIQQEEKKTVSIAELKKLYGDAKSEFERRAICLRAIDEGILFRLGPVSSIDQIFGTNFGANLPTKREGKKIGVVDFAPQSEPAPPDNSVARGYSGWFMAVEYDYDGDIQSYYLTNLHK
jgi:hypothetical protein